jgi:hypothetical protein
MNNKKYNHTEKESAALWNIVIECAVDGFNNELSDEQLTKRVIRFRTKLDKLITKKLSKKSK